MTDAVLAYSPGDLLVDRDADPDERGSVVVLRYPRNEDDEPTMAANHEIASLGRSVAEVNQDYDPSEWVVEVAFEGWLDSHVPEWRALLRDAREVGRAFYESLADYCAEWGVPKQTYTYPEARLTPRPWCNVCSRKAEFGGVEYLCPDHPGEPVVEHDPIDALDVDRDDDPDEVPV